ncbi:MAG: hypothetical protein FWB94_07225 [Chitinispirillia bacterium]|nr:hypothetical protein [Chitinispirillia bacterium]
MLIVRKRNRKEEREEKKSKAARKKRAALMRRLFFSVLVVGLLGFFIYNNLDYFEAVGESALALGKANDKDKAKDKAKAPPAPPREHRTATELLGKPEFTDGSVVVPLNSFIDDRHPAASDTPMPIQPALLSQLPRERVGGDGQMDTVTRPLVSSVAGLKPEPERVAAKSVPLPPEPAARVADPGLSAAKPDSADVRHISLKQAAPVLNSAAAKLDSVRAKFTLFGRTAVPDSAKAGHISHVHMSAPDSVKAKPDSAKAGHASRGHTPVPDTAKPALPAVKLGNESMVISNIRCRLADREDISINVSVELFYDGKALNEEVHDKRGPLTAVLINTVRGQEYGGVSTAHLRAVLLDAFNDVLTAGQLVGVDIRNFTVVQ